MVHSSFALQSSLILRSYALLFNQYSDKYIFKVEYHQGKNIKLFIIFSWKNVKSPFRLEDIHTIVLFSVIVAPSSLRGVLLFWRVRDILLPKEVIPRLRQDTESEEETETRSCHGWQWSYRPLRAGVSWGCKRKLKRCRKTKQNTKTFLGLFYEEKQRFSSEVPIVKFRVYIFP